MQELTIVYDGDCPFCTGYVRLIRLREFAGTVNLVDARGGGSLVVTIRQAGLSLDEGMVLIMDGRMYHGADCIHRLALLSTPSTAFNRLNRAVFRSRTASTLLYPVLRSLRNLVLRLLGRTRFDAGNEDGKSGNGC